MSEINNNLFVDTDLKTVAAKATKKVAATDPIKDTVEDRDRRQKSLLKIYQSQPKYPVRIAPSYAKYFGRLMRVSINGITVTVICDGSTVNVPEIFAAEIGRRMNTIDANEARAAKMANISANYESSIGQLSF